MEYFIKQGTKGNQQVTVLQYALQYSIAPETLTPDGDWGPKTQAAYIKSIPKLNAWTGQTFPSGGVPENLYKYVLMYLIEKMQGGKYVTMNIDDYDKKVFGIVIYLLTGEGYGAKRDLLEKYIKAYNIRREYVYTVFGAGYGIDAPNFLLQIMQSKSINKTSNFGSSYPTEKPYLFHYGKTFKGENLPQNVRQNLGTYTENARKDAESITEAFKSELNPPASNTAGSGIYNAVVTTIQAATGAAGSIIPNLPGKDDITDFFGSLGIDKAIKQVLTLGAIYAGLKLGKDLFKD